MTLFYRLLIWACSLERDTTHNPTIRPRCAADVIEYEGALARLLMGRME